MKVQTLNTGWDMDFPLKASERVLAAILLQPFKELFAVKMLHLNLSFPFEFWQCAADLWNCSEQDHSVTYLCLID